MKYLYNIYFHVYDAVASLEDSNSSLEGDLLYSSVLAEDFEDAKKTFIIQNNMEELKELYNITEDDIIIRRAYDDTSESILFGIIQDITDLGTYDIQLVQDICYRFPFYSLNEVLNVKEFDIDKEIVLNDFFSHCVHLINDEIIKKNFLDREEAEELRQIMLEAGIDTDAFWFNGLDDYNKQYPNTSKKIYEFFSEGRQTEIDKYSKEIVEEYKKDLKKNNLLYSSHSNWTTFLQIFLDETIDRDNGTFDWYSVEELKKYFDNKAKFFTKDRNSALLYLISERENDASVLEKDISEINHSLISKYEDELYVFEFNPQEYEILFDSEDDKVGLIIVEKNEEEFKDEE